MGNYTGDFLSWFLATLLSPPDKRVLFTRLSFNLGPPRLILASIRSLVASSTRLASYVFLGTNTSLYQERRLCGAGGLLLLPSPLLRASVPLISMPSALCPDALRTEPSAYLLLSVRHFDRSDCCLYTTLAKVASLPPPSKRLAAVY